MLTYERHLPFNVQCNCRSMYRHTECLYVSCDLHNELRLCEVVLLSKGYVVCLLRGRTYNLGFPTKQ